MELCGGGPDSCGDGLCDGLAGETSETCPEDCPAGAGSCVDNCGGFAGDCWCDTGCTGNGDCCGDYEDVCQPGGELEDCTDGFDNDEDGKVDCDDEDCAANPACIGPTPIETECADEIDNDEDGFTDCADPDCAAMPACAGGDIETECSDEADNDEDGFTDCDDPDCLADPNCGPPGLPELDCADEVDNDNDGKTDCEDSDCVGMPACDAECGNMTCDHTLKENFEDCPGDCTEGPIDSCSGKCGMYKLPDPTWTCQCDSVCHLPQYMDCCTDKLDICGPVE